MFKISRKILIVSAAVLIAVIAVIASFVLRNKLVTKTGQPADVPEDQSIVSEIDDSSANSAARRTITKNVPVYSGRPINEVRFGVGFSAPQSAIAQKTKDLDSLADALSNKDPFNINDWTAVGITKKFFNDYEGARDAWEYAAVLYPEDPLAFENLGNLYALYLHNNIKAESNYKKAITNNQYEPSYYIGLADFYKNVDTANKGKVPEVIMAGIEKIRDENLYLYLASYYRDIGDKENALKYYELVQKLVAGHPGVQEEIDRLSR